MLQKTIAYFILTLLFGCTFPFLARAQYPIINKDILLKYIKNDESGAKYFMIGTFVNYCHGRDDIPTYIKMVDSITNHETRFFICQSSHDQSDRGKALTDVINKVGIDGKYIYLIDNSTYKTKRKDGRQQGMAFRDDLCPACQFSIVSGTYYIIFNKQDIIMYSGYVLKPEQVAAILTCQGK